MVKEYYDNQYERYIAAIFKEKTDGEFSPNDEEIPFDRDDIDSVEEKYELKRIRNPSDLPYNLRGRANLPEELVCHSYDSVIIDTKSGRTDAAYLITKRKQIIELPEPRDFEPIDTSTIPNLVDSYTADNEQGILTLIRYLNLIPELVDADECYHLQDHLRTFGFAGQIEVDGLYIASKNSEPFVVLVEGKGDDEEFTRNQLAINAKTIRQKDGFPNTVVPLGVRPHDNGVFSILEFGVPEKRSEGRVEIKKAHHYSISQTNLNSF